MGSCVQIYFEREGGFGSNDNNIISAIIVAYDINGIDVVGKTLRKVFLQNRECWQEEDAGFLIAQILIAIADEQKKANQKLKFQILVKYDYVMLPDYEITIYLDSQKIYISKILNSIGDGEIIRACSLEELVGLRAV
jgi:hypothetical protein